VTGRRDQYQKRAARRATATISDIAGSSAALLVAVGGGGGTGAGSSSNVLIDSKTDIATVGGTNESEGKPANPKRSGVNSPNSLFKKHGIH